jgi:GR25 family glycosyltransferase involved in LPS biosynthesis
MKSQKILLIIVIILFIIILFIMSTNINITTDNSQENYLLNSHNTVLNSEKTVDQQNIVPSQQTSHKSEFLKIIKRLKKYTTVVKKIDIPIYYINMDKNPERREFMENQLHSYSSNITRITGYNGYKIKNLKMDTVDGISFFNNYSELKKSEIGCLMSHLITIKTAYDKGDEVALILEDDTVIDLINLLDFEFETIYKKAPSDWEMVSLFHMSKWNSEFLKKVYHSEEYQYLRHNNIDYLYSLVGYLINRKGMKKVLDFVYDKVNNIFYLGKDMSIAPNGPADFFLYDITTSYYFTPDLFYPNNLSLQSTIHSDHTDAHINRSLEVVTYYDNKIKAKEFTKHYNIPVLYVCLSKFKDGENIKKSLSIFSTTEKMESVYLYEHPELSRLESHIKMLSHTLEKYPGKDVLFCEDNIKFESDPRIFLYNFFEKKITWDVLLLSNYSQQSVSSAYKDIQRTFESTGTGCYLVRAGYINKILSVFQDSIAIYKRFGIWTDHINNADQCWKSLQKIDQWFVPQKNIVNIINTTI